MDSAWLLELESSMLTPLSTLRRTRKDITKWFNKSFADWTQIFVTAYNGRSEITHGLLMTGGGDGADDDTTDLDFSAGSVRLGGTMYDTDALTRVDLLLPTATALSANNFTAHHPLTAVGEEVSADGGPDLSSEDGDFAMISVILIDSDEAGDAAGKCRFLGIVGEVNDDVVFTSEEIAEAIDGSAGQAKDFSGNGGWALVGHFKFLRNGSSYEMDTVVDNRNNQLGL